MVGGLLLIAGGCGSKPADPPAPPVATAPEPDPGDDLPFGSKHRDQAIAAAVKFADGAMPGQLDLKGVRAAYTPMPLSLSPRRDGSSGPQPKCWIVSFPITSGTEETQTPTPTVAKVEAPAGPTAQLPSGYGGPQKLPASGPLPSTFVPPASNSPALPARDAAPRRPDGDLRKRTLQPGPFVSDDAGPPPAEPVTPAGMAPPGPGASQPPSGAPKAPTHPGSSVTGVGGNYVLCVQGDGHVRVIGRMY